jgi:hypothetical protein
MQIRSVFGLMALSCSVSGVVLAQPHVDSRNVGERMIVVVPIVGSGTYDDPKRPLFVPASMAEMVNGTSLHAFQWEPSDDGRFAIVEFATRDRATLDAVAAEPRVVKSFQKGIHKRNDIERELQKYKKDFRLDKSERKPRP